MKLTGTYRNIISIAIPLMISSLLQNLIGLIDTRFMGMLSVEDSTPLAAVGVGALYFFVLTMIPNGFSMGTQIIAARRAGEMRHQEIGKLVDNSLLFMTVIGIVLFFLIKFLTPLILPIAFESVPVQEQCVTYLNWRSYEFLVTGILMTMVAFQSGIGRTKSVMAAAIVMTGANLFFNYAFVFGKWGFPEMGIGGAGLASAISTALGALVMVVWAIMAGSRSQYGLFKFEKYSIEIIKRVTNLSSPIVIQHLAGTAVWLFFFTTIEKMGEDELAVSNIIKMVYLTLGVTAWGMGGAVNTLVSNLIGQGKPEEIFKVIGRTVVLSMAMAMLFAFLTNLYPQELLGFFVKDRPDLLLLGAPAMQVTGYALIVMAISVCLFRATMGTGATKFSLLIEILVLPLYVLYVIYVVNIREMSLAWAWGSEFVYWSFLALLCYLYLRSRRWKKFNV